MADAEAGKAYGPYAPGWGVQPPGSAQAPWAAPAGPAGPPRRGPSTWVVVVITTAVTLVVVALASLLVLTVAADDDDDPAATREERDAIVLALAPQGLVDALQFERVTAGAAILGVDGVLASPDTGDARRTVDEAVELFLDDVSVAGGAAGPYGPRSRPSRAWTTSAPRSMPPRPSPGSTTGRAPGRPTTATAR